MRLLYTGLNKKRYIAELGKDGRLKIVSATSGRVIFTPLIMTKEHALEFFKRVATDETANAIVLDDNNKTAY